MSDPSTDNPATAFLNHWIDAVNAGEAGTLTRMYADDARLLPTFSPHLLRGAAIRTYFDALVARPNVSAELHHHSVLARSLTDALWDLSGVYSFRFEVDGVLLTFPSRFTFTLDVTSDAPILTHHSSQVPRTLS